MSSAPDPPFALAPGPWQCKGQIHWLLLSAHKSLRPGTYAPLEAEAPPISTNEVGEPTGKGVGASVMIVRYSETPVGPYDELAYSPGAFTTPGGDGKPHLRISRVYVSESNPTTIYNGRRNWNVPKHPARFEFKALSDSETRISVYPPTTGAGSTETPPFFSAIVSKALNLLPSMPLSTKSIPFDSTLVLPPLPSSPSDPKYAGTDTWKSLPSIMKGKIRFLWVKPGEIKDAHGKPQFSDGVGFPKIEPWSLGIHWLPDTVFEIPVAELFTNKDKKFV
ncbi:hypothetical protein SCHPADRAFT_913514 [Schizopora paradoxa]|uniref:Uncharacterized protein n=1 Tax=Schizopora paradoxa TaxID=27342 RepID=A0A0H2S1G3_9AGAM|nr:hypothetical protein SCHPADRAFT_913514 [Schizopora paradoxa]